MANIFARSPYLIKIDEAGQSGSNRIVFKQYNFFS
jgi:hypothetical protein